MQLIYDNLVAVIVSTLLIIVLMTVKLRTQETSIDATRFHAAKTLQAQFINVIEYDLEELGSGVPTGENMIHKYARDSLGLDCIEFEKEFVDTGGNIRLGRVRYERQPAGSYATSDTTFVPLFRFERLVEAENGSMVSGGGSGESVLRFDLDLLGEDGQPVNDNLNGAESIEIALETAMPFELAGRGSRERTAVQRMSWQGQFRPSNLSNRSDESGGVVGGC